MRATSGRRSHLRPCPEPHATRLQVKNEKDNKSPGFWFYPADYERDVQVLSLPAQGLWMRMICWAAANESHRGFLELQSGEPMNEDDIAARVGRSPKDVKRCLDEMKRVGIFTTDPRGCIFSRRMARESSISDARKKAADSRWEKARRAAGLHEECTDFAPAKVDAKNMQNPSVTASVSDPVSTNTHTHHPARGTLDVERTPLDLGDVFSEMYDQHPKKGWRIKAEHAWAELMSTAVHPEKTAESIMESHARWRKFWADGGGRCIGFELWLAEKLYLENPLETSKSRDSPAPQTGWGNHGEEFYKKHPDLRPSNVR